MVFFKLYIIFHWIIFNTILAADLLKIVQKLRLKIFKYVFGLCLGLKRHPSYLPYVIWPLYWPLFFNGQTNINIFGYLRKHFHWMGLFYIIHFYTMVVLINITPDCCFFGDRKNCCSHYYFFTELFIKK